MIQLVKGVKFEDNTVYLTGNISSPEAEKSSKNDIEYWTNELKALGFKVITPFKLFEKTDTSKYSDTDLMRNRVRAMLLCEKVYTLPDWDVCEKTTKEVNVARTLGIEVNTVLNLVRVNV